MANGGWRGLGLMWQQDMGGGNVAGLGGGWSKEARAQYASAEGFVGGPLAAHVKVECC